MGEEAKVKIYRYDPVKDEEPRYETYSVPFTSGMKVLDAVLYIYRHIDGTLGFKYCCCNSHCGLCGANVNGSPVLMCREPAEKEMVIEPLDNLPVVRDLIVDRDTYEKRLPDLRLFLDRNGKAEEEPEKVNMEAFGKFKLVSRCVECLNCISVCPVFSENNHIFNGPASFVQMARHFYDERDDLNREIIAISDGVYNCTNCRSCVDACPHDIKPVEQILNMRHDIYEDGLSNDTVNNLADLVKDTGLATKSLRGKETLLESESLDQEGQNDKIGLFIGCNMNTSPKLNSVVKAGLKLLEASDVEVITPKDQVCCGQPLHEIGADAEMDRLIEKNVKLFEKENVSTVLTLCAGCSYGTQKFWPEHYKEITGNEMDFEVKDMIEYLINEFDFGKCEELSAKVTYHDPCILNRGLGINKEPRDIIKQIPGVELVEMENADHCCGGGGGLRVNNLKLSQALGKKKVEKIIDSGVKTVITACPTCIKQIDTLLKKARVRDVEVIHLVELMARSCS